VKEGQLITSRFARAGGSAKLNPESYRDTSIKPAFSNKGFEKPYSADYEGRPDGRIVSMVYRNH
jgi:hypothetical protein